MNIKKKIAVWCALFALLVALVPLDSARANTTETTADDVKYRDIEDFMHSAGYTSFVKNEGSLYLVSDTGSYWCVEEINGVLDWNPFWLYDSSWGSIWYFADIAVTQYMCKYYNYYEPLEASIRDNFDIVNSGSNGYGTSNGVYWNGFNAYYAVNYGNESNVLYSDLDIYQVEPVTAGTTRYVKNTDNVYFESSVYGNFSFPVWCQYAGLNCLASSNESPTKIPYSYNSYWHIVRKTSNGKWLLTTVGSTLGQAKMSMRLTEDNSKLMIYEFSGDDSFTLSVRQYEYDTDGWKVRTYDTYNYDDFTSGILTLGVGTGIDSARMIAYTNTPIYSSDGLSVSIPVSSEYYEVEMPDIPEQEVTPTPTGAPSGGGASSGTMITYKPALSGKVSADSLNMRKEASADSEIVAAFVNTWSLTLHGFVNTSDGAVWYFCTAERDGVTYTGYVLSEYVEIVGSSGSSGSDGESTLDEKLAEALKELEALAIFVARVPMIIGIIFSFMPSWCLVLFGFAFGFLVLKAIVSR